MKKLILSLTLFSLAFTAMAQTTPEEMASDPNKTGGVYFAYPSDKADNTPAPKGYKPFHISHYGRHGSRYLIGDNDYEWIANLLHKAQDSNALTPVGVELMSRIDSLMIETKGRGGDLSPLGRRQHYQIARRMIQNYPEVFSSDSHITARSTLVPRCILSMSSFCESLKEKNPALYIDMESSNRNMAYLCHSIPESDEFNGKKGWWQEVYRKFEQKQTKPDRVVKSIFSDSDFVNRYVNPHDFIWGIYWLASDAQNTEGKIDFYDFLTNEELFDMWQCFNARFYGQHADYPPANGVHLQNAANLLNNIIDTADAAICSDKPSAALRFGHDGNVVPLTSLMQLEGCTARIDAPEDFYKGWCDWKVTPMAANIQLIFFRNPKTDKVLVKILHNEKETRVPVETDLWPYYDWNDVKAFFKSQIR
ncbi:MAG: histidine phosphatase family protein [Muribaculaceae bacterium]|nr:histidine phosphatase family protein [Muribaculaceae bacterium]